ncbi:MAG: recombinase family protein [Alphaproteobacteria bacterium]|nr:recombinase family protein [Alphaproteobacteria bacterium]
MNKGEAYIYRLGKSELFIAAPNDESHELAFASLGSKAKFDSLLEEWRIPWNDTNPKSDPLDFVQNLKDSVKKLKKPVVIGKIFGYAQITYGEGAESQVDAFRSIGIPDEQIFLEKLEGRYPSREKLNECIRKLKAGDTLVVLEFNKLARSLKQLSQTLTEIKNIKAHVRSLNEGIDTAKTEYGSFVDNISYALSFEQKANSIRTKAGLKEASAQGRRRGGRRSKLTREMIERIAKLALEEHTDEEIARYVGVSRATIYRNLPKMEEIRNAHKEGGMDAVQEIIDEVASRLKTGITDAKRDEILGLYKADYSIQWITDYTGFNRETIRAVIEAAFK